MELLNKFEFKYLIYLLNLKLNHKNILNFDWMMIKFYFKSEDKFNFKINNLYYLK